MKYFFPIIFFLLFCFQSHSQTFNDRLYDTLFLKKNKVKSIIEYVNNSTDTNGKFVKENKYDVDKNGVAVINLDDLRNEMDTLLQDKDSVDKQKRPIVRYFNSGYSDYTEWYEYDTKGRHSTTHLHYRNKKYLIDSTIYDNKGNAKEIFQPGWHPPRGIPDDDTIPFSDSVRYVMTYDSENRMVSKREYTNCKYFSILDSNVYGKQGKLIEQCRYEIIHDTLKIFSKFVRIYDNKGNEISAHIYRVINGYVDNKLELQSINYYKYNEKNQPVEVRFYGSNNLDFNGSRKYEYEYYK